MSQHNGKPKISPVSAIQLFQNGEITATDFCTFVHEHLTKDNLKVFLAAVPTDLLVLLRRFAADTKE